MKLLIVLIILGIILISGCVATCEFDKMSCEHRCGEGIIGGLCKDGCALEYNQCIERN